jgi:hypothetical protein
VTTYQTHHLQELTSFNGQKGFVDLEDGADDLYRNACKELVLGTV